MRRITGAAALGYVVFAAIERGRADEARLPALALVALPAGALAAVVRTDGEPRYVVALVVLIVAGVVVLSAARDAVARTGRSARSPAPRRSPARPSPGRTAPTRP